MLPAVPNPLDALLEGFAERQREIEGGRVRGKSKQS
jgi:hypothetical protein